MRKLSFIILSLFIFVSAYTQVGKQIVVTFPSQYGLGTVGMLRYFPADSATGNHPLIIFLHGSGERGSSPATIATNSNSLPALCAGNATMKFTVSSTNYSFIVLSPQLPLSFGLWDVKYIKDVYNYAIAHYNVDKSRVYLSGLSLGGGGVWLMLADSVQWVAKFAAFNPICGTQDADRAKVLTNINATGKPFWCIHSTDDNNGATFNGGSSQYYQFATTTNDSTRRYTYYTPVTQHSGCWQKGYDTGHATRTVDSSNTYCYPYNRSATATYVQNPNLYEWLLSKTSDTNALLAPSPQAGADQIINLPTSSITLSGSTTIYNGGPITSHTWSKTSGGSATIASTSNYTTTITGLTVGSYVFRLTVTDSAAQTSYDEMNVTVNDSPHVSQMLPILDIRPMSASDREDPYKSVNFSKYFGLVDPKNGITSFPTALPFAPGVPYKQNIDFYCPDTMYQYPRKRGNRLILDMTFLKNRRDITKTVHITDIYGFAFDGQTPPDSLFFYKLDTMCTSIDDFWKFIAYPDSLLQRFAVLTPPTSGGPGWAHASALNIDLRYMLIRYVYNDRGPNNRSTPNFGALTVYGTKNYDPTTVVMKATSYTGVDPAVSPPYDQFDGTNLGQGYDTLQLQYDGNIRVYTAEKVNDTTTQSIYDPRRKVYAKDNYPDIGPIQYPAFKRKGQKMWWSQQGNSTYIDSATTHYRRLLGKNINQPFPNVDTVNADPENPKSYLGDAVFYHDYAALNGSVAVDTALTHYSGIANGQKRFKRVEIGNEMDIRAYTYLAIWCRLMAAYDGWENRMGTPGHVGANNADPNFELLMGGLAFLDTIAFQNFIFFSQIGRTDGKWPFKIFNAHKYKRSTDSLNYAPNLDQQVGSKGVGPLTFPDMITELNADKRALYAAADGDTSYKIAITEYGYGNWGSPSTTPVQAAGYEQGRVPSAGGRDSMQNKAKFLSESEIVMMACGVVFYNEFFFHNSDFGANTFLLFQDDGRTTGRDIVNFRATVFFPWWYVRAFMHNNMRGYQFDRIIVNGLDTGLNHFRFRNIAHPDSTLDIVWLGSNNGTTVSRTISTGAKISSNFTIKEYSFSDITGTASTATGSGSTLSLPTVKETMEFVFSQDSGAPVITDFWRGRRKRIFK